MIWDKVTCVRIVMWFVSARCVHQPFYLSMDGNGHMESTIGIQARGPQWKSWYDEGCLMRRAQMTLVKSDPMTTKWYRSPSGYCLAEQPEGYNRIESISETGGTWETLEGSWKTWRVLRKPQLKGPKTQGQEIWIVHGSFVKQKMQERFGNIGWADLFFSAAAKHSLLLLICIFPSSQREHFSAAKNKFQRLKLSTPWIFFLGQRKTYNFSALLWDR